MLKVGALTFGGGYARVPRLQGAFFYTQPGLKLIPEYRWK